jgi:hypothetical protein
LAHIQLAYDPPLRAFGLHAFVVLPEPWGHPPASLSPWRAVKMTVDTGAFNSALADGVARSLGLPVESLPREVIGGSTGRGSVPFLRHVFLRPRVPEALPILLPKVSILPADLEAPRAAPSSRGAAAVPRPAGPLNLLGMDVLQLLRSRVALDLENGTGSLRW